MGRPGVRELGGLPKATQQHGTEVVLNPGFLSQSGAVPPLTE